MEPIKAVGTDYGMTAPQIQQPAEEDYSSMPVVYDPSVEEKKASASSGVGMKALAAVAIAGLALWGGHAWGAKGSKKAAAAAEEAKAAAEEAKNALQKKVDDAIKIADEEPKWYNNGVGKRCKRIKEALTGEVKEAENKVDDAAKEGAEKAVEKTEEAAK